MPMGITEDDIVKAEELRAAGHFHESLALTLAMLDGCEDDATRMRLLFDLVCNSSQLGRDDLTDKAIKELSTMPEPEVSVILATVIVANALIDRGDPRGALTIINNNLQSEVLARPHFMWERYDHLAYKGKALRALDKWHEALDTFRQAQQLASNIGEPDNLDRERYLHWMSKEIKRNMVHCLIGLKECDRAYQLAKELWEHADRDSKTLDRYYMGACLIGAGRLTEAITILQEVRHALPSPLVNESDVIADIEACMNALSISSASSKPS